MPAAAYQSRLGFVLLESTDPTSKVDRPNIVSLPDEPLAESAPLTYQAAQELCLADAESGGSCRYYHGAWQFLRALGLIKKLGGQAPFIVNVLADLAADGGWPRVMVAGAADYSMAAHVYHAYEDSELQLTLVDRCKTPLAMNDWYSTRIGRPITLIHEDLLAYESAEPYDVAVTSSLLGNFSAEQQAGLFQGFARLLRPGGKLIFTNQVDNKPVPIWSFEDDAVRQLGRTARNLAVDSVERFGFDPDLVEEVALEYGRRRRIHPTPLRAELQQRLEDAGLKIERFDILQEGGAFGVQIAGPSMDEARYDARVVAVRV